MTQVAGELVGYLCTSKITDGPHAASSATPGPSWCQSSSEEPGIKRKFKDLMENCGDGSDRTRIGIVFRGLALADEVGEKP